MTTISIRFSREFYGHEAILLAAVDLAPYADITLDSDEGHLLAQTTYDGEKITAAEVISRVNRAVADSQLRVTIGEKTSAIRQMIIAQAFAPCDNLPEIVGVYERHDR